VTATVKTMVVEQK